MKINKGMFRIYVTLSFIWFVYWYHKGDSNFNFQPDNNDWMIILLTAVIPLPLYFVLKWILKGFE
jgi:magnesium-transporting ATPase (P-type)